MLDVCATRLTTGEVRVCFETDMHPRGALQ
jgi:hypothetical protein